MKVSSPGHFWLLSYGILNFSPKIANFAFFVEFYVDISGTTDPITMKLCQNVDIYHIFLNAHYQGLESNIRGNRGLYWAPKRQKLPKIRQ